ncbi:DUF3800 domain-containing protein [Rickettsiales bacterium]|nr:DUF3800 domain-containing protein [Rickettsiales bacterium]MDB2550286.1 DUF3800 domain-containing protein [Rickettsiales bacterium]
MQFLYLDESGDLGFDFKKEKTSKFFTITILYIKSISDNKFIISEIKKTIKRKINIKDNSKFSELKGSSKIEIKKYLFNKIKDIDFEIYSLTIDKVKFYRKKDQRFFLNQKINKISIYDSMVVNILEDIKVSFNIKDVIEIIIDKSKSKYAILLLNNKILKTLKNNNVKIDHKISNESLGIQLSDLFCRAVRLKYEKKEDEFFNLLGNKVRKNNLVCDLPYIHHPYA